MCQAFYGVLKTLRFILIEPVAIYYEHKTRLCDNQI